MDPVRAMLLTLARRAKGTHLYWQAGLAAVRAREEIPQRGETFAHAAQAELCLVDALRAADLPGGFRIDGITLQRHPVTAMKQLRDHVHAWTWNGPIEADHEQARLAYRELAADALTDQEHALAVHLAGLSAARRDKVLDTAEHLARHQSQQPDDTLHGPPSWRAVAVFRQGPVRTTGPGPCRLRKEHAC